MDEEGVIEIKANNLDWWFINVDLTTNLMTFSFERFSLIPTFSPRRRRINRRWLATTIDQIGSQVRRCIGTAFILEDITLNGTEITHKA